MNISDIVNSIVALGTLALAGSTFWLVRVTKRLAANQVHSEQRNLLRAALIEQMENCRQWHSHPTNLGPERLLPLKGWYPTFTALYHLLGALDVPGDFAAYLVWLANQARETAQRGQSKLLLIEKVAADGSHDSLGEPGTFHDTWSGEMDHLQVIACLLVAEARRRGFVDVSDAFAPDAPWLPWLQPDPWPNDRNRSTTAQGDQVYRQAPPWPQDPVYTDCKPEARDRAAELAFGQLKTTLMAGASDTGGHYA